MRLDGVVHLLLLLGVYFFGVDYACACVWGRAKVVPRRRVRERRVGKCIVFCTKTQLPWGWSWKSIFGKAAGAVY
jgi:hypothetical protein